LATPAPPVRPLFTHACRKVDGLARRNYSYEKRQKDLARKKKQDLKRQRKLEKKNITSQENPEGADNLESTDQLQVEGVSPDDSADPQKTTE